MPIFATAGAKVFIGSVIAPKSEDFVAADFTSQIWERINNLESIGTFGDTATEITFDDIGLNRTQKIKGTRNAGNLEMVTGIDYADAGQIALLAAEKAIHDYAFKIEFNDAPAGGTPSQRMFIAKVMSAAEALDTANNVMKLNSTLGINSNIVRVNAAEV
ncbi:hypothetical protein KUG47_13000 [Falsochrobactrum sp. TDYN1]|uniref:Phage tail protein n=1 Tax=Falsochrobactrum tianjinense TaxID=2706015 RepID=A0A949PNA9_9HYPH|nr:hypothetical protein [Falsochrobactrum sp. TDYN1]MBV2144412.1 hypothetical protein [Falsochrobactrum sp. TDYN1]